MPQPKTAAGAFLAGATSRLLPASIPFRYFGAALCYHLLAWLALLAGAAGVPRFAGGLGWPLAALHLVTLGVLVMVAIGASLQLLPVATRQPLRSVRWAAAIWWLYTPGVACVALGIGSATPRLLALGALAVALALLVFAALLANNLHHARGMRAVVVHGWAALGCLLVVLATALALALSYLGLPLLERATALTLHLAFASYGFMGLLAFGLSLILVPMFALSAAPDERQSIAACGLAVAALVLAALGAFGVAPLPLRVGAIGVGAAAVAIHLRLMHGALRSGMRRTLGRSLTLVRIGWAALVASLGVALALQLDAQLAARFNLPTLFGVTLIVGWLLSFLLGMLQRILPFLASMHAAQGRQRPATPSSLSFDAALALHFACHVAALAALVLAVAADSASLAALAAGTGAVGAAAFAAFFVVLLRRMRAAAAPARPPVRPAA